MGNSKYSLTAIIKITNNCNLRCKYCYTPDEAFQGNMSIGVLSRFINETSKYIELRNPINFTFLWHGGEPLLLGLEYFKSIKKMQDRIIKGNNYVNLVQSNITLLTDEYCEFFIKNNFKLSTSLDGPPKLHDSNRVYRDGKGSFNDVFSKIKMAKNHGIDISTLLVINRQNIDKIEELYDFFQSENIDCKFSLLTLTGQALHNYEHVYVHPDEYADCIIKLYELWINDTKDTSYILNLEDLIDTILQNAPVECTHLRNCQRHFFSISPNGDVYPCGRFQGIDKLCYGNINKIPLIEILDSKRRKSVIKLLDERNKRCAGCEWLNICNGGCMHHAYNGVGDIEKDYYCSAYKRIFEHVKESIKKELINAMID